MVFNIFIFVRVIVVMVQHTREKAVRLKETVSKKTIVRLIISISGVMFLFGLTWLFAILTVSVPGLRETFQILFVVFNSFQGVFVFLFICVLNKEALESWKELLSCGKYRSKLLHPSPVKFTAAANKPKQINTSSTGFSSSSGGKYASETLKSGYDSSTLTEGIVLTSVRTPSESDQVLTETSATLAGTAITNEATSGVLRQNGSTSGEGKEEERIEKNTFASKDSVVEIEVDVHSDDSGRCDKEEATELV